MKIINLERKTIAAEIGRQGENNATVIRFAIPDDWNEPTASYTVRVTRPGEEDAYVPEGTAVADGVVTWTVNSADTAIAGCGKAQICCVANGRIIKSRTFITHITESVGMNNEVVTAPEQSVIASYLEMISAYAAGAQADKNAAAVSEQNAASSASSANADKLLMDSRLALVSAEIREQVLAAVTQVIETGSVGDIDTGFVTTLKEIAHGLGFRIWLGTTAEFEALQTNNLLEQNVLYIRTDDKSIKFIGEIDPTTPLLTIITTYGNYLSYRLSVIPNTNIYPITLTAPTQNSNAAVVTMQKSGSAGYFTFEYGGDVWIAHFYASSAQGGYTIGSWKKLAKEETDSGWQALTISGTGFSAPSSGGKIPRYRKIGNRMYIQGFVMADMDTVGTPDVNTPFAQLASGYRPSQFFYLHAPSQGAREAGVLVDAAGNISIAYLKDSSGTNVTTGEYWIQLDCDFLTD